VLLSRYTASIDRSSGIYVNKPIGFGVGRGRGFFTIVRSTACEHTPRSSRKQLNRLRASACNPFRRIRDDLRPASVSSRPGVQGIEWHCSRWVSELTMRFPFEIRMDAEADKTAVYAVAAPLDVTHRAARPSEGHWGSIPLACR